MESEGGEQSSRPGRTGRSALAPTWSHPSRAGLHSGAPASPPPPAQRPLPPGPARGAWPGAAAASCPSAHTRVPPPRLCPARSPGWCSRRLWAASNAALRVIPAQPPPPPRRSPPAPPAEPSPRPLPAPAQPLGGIVRTPLARRSGWACSRLQRSILRAQWPCRLSRHKAGALPTPLPPRPPLERLQFFF